MQRSFAMYDGMLLPMHTMGNDDEQGEYMELSIGMSHVLWRSFPSRRIACHPEYYCHSRSHTSVSTSISCRTRRLGQCCKCKCHFASTTMGAHAAALQV